MLLWSLFALCNAPGGPGRIWKYLEALEKAAVVSGRLACSFRTDLHFPDVLGREARREAWKNGLGNNDWAQITCLEDQIMPIQ